MSTLTSSMRNFVDEILALDDAIRYGIFGTKEHTLMSIITTPGGEIKVESEVEKGTALFDIPKGDKSE